MENKLGRICRTCKIVNLHDFNSTNIFLPENYEIITKLQACANIKLESNDQLPKFICDQCEFELNEAFNFRIKCECSDEDFRNIIKMSNSCIKLCEEGDAIETNKSEVLCNNNNETIKMADLCDDYIEKEDTIDQPIETYMELTIEKLDDSDSEFDISDLELTNSDCELDSKVQKPDNLRMKKKPENKTYPCETCDEVFDAKSKYNKHVITHGNKRFKCSLCPFWGKYKHKLSAHFEHVHNRSLACICELCGLVSSNKTNLNRHISQVHEKSYSFSCEMCDKKYTRAAMLKDHVDLKHNDEKKYFCSTNECKEAFKAKSQLRLHQSRVHFKDFALKISNKRKETKRKNLISRKHECAICFRRFNCNSLLQDHLGWHRGEKKYACEFCDKKFATGSGLFFHRKIHTGDKPYECDICHKRFRQMPHLKSHKYIHSKTKNFTCEFCNGKFTYHSSLNDHKKKYCSVLKLKNVAEETNS